MTEDTSAENSVQTQLQSKSPCSVINSVAQEMVFMKLICEREMRDSWEGAPCD